MIRPPKLERGDLVRIVAPASHFDRERFNRGVRVLEEDLGLRPRWRDDLFTQQRFLAGDDSRRAAELHEAFSDRDARAVFCARGGYGVTRIIPHLDPVVFRDNPKVFIGFSDITALLMWMERQVELVAFHGPMVTGRMSFGLSKEDTEAFERAVMKDEPAGPIGSDGARTIVGGRAEGRLIGGNLKMLEVGLATPYAPHTEGAILFLEDSGEKPYAIDRMLHHLQQAGAFDGIAGLALGDFVDCENPADPENSAEQVLTDFAEELGVPAVMGLPFGHGENNRTLPVGVSARLDADLPELTITESAVS